MELIRNGARVKVPDFMIVGAPRCGTTSLYRNLLSHPDIFIPAIKEPMYFCDFGDGVYHESDLGNKLADWIVRKEPAYLDLFREAKDGQQIGEASTWYLCEHEQAIPKLLDFYGDRATELKIIIMLRHPADRTWSHYNHNRNLKREHLSFRESIRPEVIHRRINAGMVPSFDVIRASSFSGQIRAYQEAFPHVRVWIFEEFFADLASHMADVLDFLSVPFSAACVSTEVVNPSGSPKGRSADWMMNGILRNSIWKSTLKRLIPGYLRARLKRNTLKKLLKPDPMPGDIRRELCDQFAPEIEAVEQLLGRRIEAWHEGDGS